MLRSGETKVAKENFYGSKKPNKYLRCWCWWYSYLKISWNTNSKKSNFLIGYLDKVIGPLVLVLPKWVDMLRHLKLKMAMKMKTINWYLFL